VFVIATKEIDMTTHIKTLAAAALFGALATPGFAAAHLDLNSMTCGEYNQLGGADRDKVAMMAVSELNEDVQLSDGTATATKPITTADAGESTTDTTIAANNGTATATNPSAAGDDMTRYQEEIAILNRTCSRNWDAMVKEAAAGQSGTR